MKGMLTFLLAGVAFAATAQERPAAIDPNTKIQGGADVRGSSSSAGVGAQTENKTDAEKPLSSPQAAHPPEIRDGSDAEKDRTISERKPQEREREDASRGETRSAPQQ